MTLKGLFIGSFLIALLALFGHHWLMQNNRNEASLDDSERTQIDVDAVMKALAESYFEDSDGPISRTDFDSLYNQTTDGFTSRHATMLVQVINKRIFVDLAHFTTQFSWDILRSQFILGKLQETIRRNEVGSFEFLLNTHDCPMRNFAGGKLAVMTMTKCKGIATLPVPQWFRWRDGAFGNWDHRIEEAYLASRSVPWEEKESRAVFRGALRRSTLRECDGSVTGLDFTTIDLSNWKELSRSKLYHLGQLHPDLLDVGISKEPGNVDQAALLQQIGWQPSPRISMADQSKRFKYVVYMEGACGWADRLKLLLAAGFVVFLQDTPCTEFFTPLIKPMVHYVPLRNDLEDLVERIRWAREHDEEAREIAENAAELAARLLPQSAVDSYIYHLFRQYGEHYNALQPQYCGYKMERRPGTVEFIRPVNCHVSKNMSCDVSRAFIP